MIVRGDNDDTDGETTEEIIIHEQIFLSAYSENEHLTRF